MTVQNPPIFLQAGSHPAEDVRRMFTGLMDGRQGVIKGLTVTEKSGTANMSVDVAEGSAFIGGTEATYQGLYFVENRGVTNLVISASDPTNARYDLIVAKVQDAGYSGATNAWSLAVVTGIAAATPLFPAVPSNAIVLARVLVSAAVASIVNASITSLISASATDGTTTLINRGFAAAKGGTIVCTSTTRPTTSLYEGIVIYETDTNRQYTYSGSAWVLTNDDGWTNVTPFIYQSVSVTKTVNYCRSRRSGNTVRFQGYCSITSAGTVANSVQVELPTTAAAYAAGGVSQVLGHASLYDLSANVSFQGIARLQGSGTRLSFLACNGSSIWGLTGGAFDNTMALANGDVITWDVEYEV